jgi:hypothetical protein
MGTEIITYEDCDKTNTNLLLKRFWGGRNRGICFVLTSAHPDNSRHQQDNYIEITEKEMNFLMYKKLKNDYDELQNKDTLYDGHIRYINAIHKLIIYLKDKYDFQ